MYPMFKNAKLKLEYCPNPTVPIWNLTANMKAMLLGKLLSYSALPKVIELLKELARDAAVLDKFSMDRTIVILLITIFLRII